MEESVTQGQLFTTVEEWQISSAGAKASFPAQRHFFFFFKLQLKPGGEIFILLPYLSTPTTFFKGCKNFTSIDMYLFGN